MICKCHTEEVKQAWFQLHNHLLYEAYLTRPDQLYRIENKKQI